jgi:Flp pilus assembly protein TadB
MSKQRAQRRTQREQEAAAVAAARAIEVERQRRRTARKAALTSWLPKQRKGPGGIIAQRRRTRATLFVISVIVVNLLVWLASGDWAVRFLALALSLLITPLVLILMTS